MRRLVLLAVLGSSFLATSSGLAAPEPGLYSGTDSGGKEVSLVVNSSGTGVSIVNSGSVSDDCTQGSVSVGSTGFSSSCSHTGFGYLATAYMNGMWEGTDGIFGSSRLFEVFATGIGEPIEDRKGYGWELQKQSGSAAVANLVTDSASISGSKANLQLSCDSTDGADCIVKASPQLSVAKQSKSKSKLGKAKGSSGVRIKNGKNRVLRIKLPSAVRKQIKQDGYVRVVAKISTTHAKSKQRVVVENKVTLVGP